MAQYPSSDQHLAFLVKLQRLLSEGDFTATYKFALLMALADIAVGRGHDDVRPLDIPMRDIAEKFIDYYWQQTMPYSSGLKSADQTTGILSQNMGTTAKVVSDIQKFRNANHIDSIARAKQFKAFSKLVTSVAQTVSKQPVTYLQNIAGGTDPFVYDRSAIGVQLKPGVSSHLRKFHGLIQHMARDRWIRHIKSNKRNIPILGQKDDLHSFLFETNRNALGIVSKNLSKLFSKKCFYCGGRINDTPDVDHFIPFSMYGRDIAQNFVLAHGACNRSKSDILAAKRHVENWLQQITRYQDNISQIALDAGVISDQQTILSVAKWSYQQGHEAGAHAWVKKGEFERIGNLHSQVITTILDCSD
ncbi:MAG: HNH endonuclease [Burkholderiaceae bacterium]|nr:HNH endonuclease [Burkholderiaceae bacterium]